MKYLIVNVHSFRNKGCEAFVKIIISEISKLDVEATFRVLTGDPYYDKYMLDLRNTVFLDDPFRKWHLSKRWQYLILNKIGISKTIRKTSEALRWADIVISPDDVFGSTYGYLNQALMPIRMGTSLKKPVFLIGQSIGPFKEHEEYDSFRKEAKNVKLITTRESLTFEYVKGMHLRNTRVELTADPAFLIKPNNRNKEQLLCKYKIPDHKTLVGIAPSQAIANFAKDSYKKHLKIFIDITQKLIEDPENHIVLVPHVQDTAIMNNDSIICEKIYRTLKFPNNMSVLNMNHSAEEIRAITSRFNIMLAERMHAAIAGLSENVPTIAIGYSAKAKGILGDIFGFENLEDYLISVKNLEYNQLYERIRKIRDREKDIRNNLLQTIPKIKERAQQNFTIINDMLYKIGFLTKNHQNRREKRF